MAGRGGGPDVFAHYSNIAAQGFRELQEGQNVEFAITQGQRGPQKENIRYLIPAPERPGVVEGCCWRAWLLSPVVMRRG